MPFACNILIISGDEERLVDRFRLDADDEQAAELEIMNIMASESLKRDEPPSGWMLEYRGSQVSEEEWALLPPFGD